MGLRGYCVGGGCSVPAGKVILESGSVVEHNERLAGQAPIGSDTVNHPKHYAAAFPLEVIDIIKLCLDEIDRRELDLSSFQKACFKDEIKYRFRAGLKDDAAEDIAKAMKYKEFRECN